jgi:hypothetical protein
MGGGECLSGSGRGAAIALCAARDLWLAVVRHCNTHIASHVTHNAMFGEFARKITELCAPTCCRFAIPRNVVHLRPVVAVRDEQRNIEKSNRFVRTLHRESCLHAPAIATNRSRCSTVCCVRSIIRHHTNTTLHNSKQRPVSECAIASRTTRLLHRTRRISFIK